MSRAKIREQLNQLEYLSKRLSALQSRDEMARKNVGEDQPLIRRSKEELEQEADYLTLVPRTVFSPTAPTVTETTFSTGPPYHLATSAPGVGLPLPPPPPPPPPSKLTRPTPLPGLNPTLGQPHVPFLPPIPEAYIPPPPAIPTTTVIQSTAAATNAIPSSAETARVVVTTALSARGNQIPIVQPNPTGLRPMPLSSAIATLTRSATFKNPGGKPDTAQNPPTAPKKEEEEK